MSDTNSCRREEVASCQPDRTIIVAGKPQEPCGSKECAEKVEMSEKQFLRDHSLYSAISSWLFAISGATNIGVLSVVASKVLNASEKGIPLFKSNDPNIVPALGNKKFNRIALGMTAFGGVCMALSNWLESKKVVTEWQLGGRFLRKANIAEKHNAEQAKAEQTVTGPSSVVPKSKSWVAAIEPKADEPVKQLAV